MLIIWCDLVRIVSITVDSSIRIYFVTLQSSCTLPTLWSSSSVQYPGTCPTGSLELVPQEWTRTSPTRPIYRMSLLPYHPHPVLGSSVSSRRFCQIPWQTTTLWQNCPKRGLSSYQQ